MRSGICGGFMKQPIISFEHFGFKYNAQVEPTLFDINLTIYEGEKILIAGPSGCGKSTLAHCINGLIPFSYKGKMTGSLRLGSRETKDMSLFEISKTVGTVLQDSDAQFIGLTVAEDIAFVLENDMVSFDDMHNRVKTAAQTVDIANHLKNAPQELSGGQKQRVSLAGVLVDNIRVLLFDEPLANLDPAAGKQTIELLDKIRNKTNSTVIIIEHRLEDVLHRDVDRIILMNDGRILADMRPDELLSTNLLRANGIREPLYITALKYAGIDIRPEMFPRNISSIRLSEEDKKKLQGWYENAPPSNPKPPGDVLLSARDVSFTYPNNVTALHNIRIEITKGEMMSIVGSNGAGKSTFAKLICGFERHSEDSLFLSGMDLSQYSIKERADHIGYVMQNPNQMLSKTMIFDEVALGLKYRKVPEAEVKNRVEFALKICGLYPFRNWPVSALSYGQKKRVTIASILVLDPEIIILDEPTAGQDFKHYTEIMEVLRELNQRSVTVVLITLDMHLMLKYCSRAAAFSGGHLVADDTPANILSQPDTISKASLKETSLFTLAVRCGIADPEAFISRFIENDRRERSR